MKTSLSLFALLAFILSLSPELWAQQPGDLPPANLPPPLDGSPPPDAPPVDQPPPSDPPSSTAISGTPELGNAVPEPFRDDRYEATFKKNPFLTKTTVVTPPPGEGLAGEWELKGMQDLNGVQRVTLLNKKTAQFKRIGPDADSEGLRLVKMNLGATRKERSVEIAKGTETATLNFSEAPSPAAQGRPQGLPGQAGGGVQARAPFAGNVNAQPPQNGVRPAGMAGGVQQGAQQQNGIRPPGVTNYGRPNNAMPPNVTPGMPGQQTIQGQQGTVPGAAAPTSGSRRRLLVPTPAPQPGAQ